MLKRYSLVFALSTIASFTAMSQGAIDALNFTQTDLKGTARYMSMGGAFGALGGDLSAITKNPGGIGVYRSSEIGISVGLDAQSANAFGANTPNFNESQTKLLLNNIGIVGTLKLDNSTFPNLNIGFSYNKGASFNRKYRGSINNLENSLTNYIAGMSNANNVTIGDLETTYSTSGQIVYDPYNPRDGFEPAPWLSILGYESYFITPTDINDNYSPKWVGQFGDYTTGVGSFDLTESGSLDEYNIVLGGNIENVVFWGMNFDITNFSFEQESIWQENLSGAYVGNDQGTIDRTSANWSLYNYYRCAGTGFNYQLGVIVKPIQELRIGLAFHTPTWYTLTQTYYASTNYCYGDAAKFTNVQTNQGYDASNVFNFRTPCKLIASAAGVIGNRVIISADYEWIPTHAAHYSVNNSNGYGWGYGDDDWWWGDYYWAPEARSTYGYDPYENANNEIKEYLTSQSSLRLGAEVRVTPKFSLRAGYSYVSSPVKENVREDKVMIATAGTQPAYRFDNSTNYITAGLGYKVKKFYLDLAYVYRHTGATYHAYTPDTAYGAPSSPQAKLSLNNNQVVLSAGFKF